MIKRLMKERGVKAAFFHSSSFPTPSNLLYLSGFECERMSVFLSQRKALLLTSGFEVARAKKEASIRARGWEDYGYNIFLKRTKRGEEALLLAMKALLRKEKVRELHVPRDFPASLFQRLKVFVRLSYLPDIVEEARSLKSPGEMVEMVKAQKAVHQSMERAISVIHGSSLRGRNLFYRKAPLTETSLKREISRTLLDHGCREPIGNIVACGRPASDPHYSGSDRALKAGEPIVIDIFPREERGYWADCTRTVIKGRPTKKVRAAYEAVLGASEACLDAIGDGIRCKEAYGVACDALEKEGFRTLRSDPVAKKGFIHGLGHGVGLDIHERPFMNFISKETLKSSNVVTIEPGVYDPSWGGIRIEDMVLIKKGGIKNFTKLGKEFAV